MLKAHCDVPSEFASIAEPILVDSLCTKDEQFAALLIEVICCLQSDMNCFRLISQVVCQVRSIPITDSRHFISLLCQIDEKSMFDILCKLPEFVYYLVDGNTYF